MELSRRGLITGLISFVAAPAIVRASSLMPVKALETEDWEYSGFYSLYPGGCTPEVSELLRARIVDAEKLMGAWLNQRLYGDHPDQIGGLESLIA